MERNSNKIVSSDNESLILVDKEDNEIGHLSKVECHKNEGVLHRAFSIFLFNDKGHLLIQKRSSQKKLWPLYWSNTCCSHPREGEDILDAAMRRLEDELGINGIHLEYLYKFSYQASYKDIGSENEMCSVFIGSINGDVIFNANEIESIRFIDCESLEQEMHLNSDYTPWFKMEWRAIKEKHSMELEKYIKAFL